MGGDGRRADRQRAAFAASIRACEAALAAHVDWSLQDVLRGVPGAPTLERVDVVQPALWAVMVSLARLWQAYGVQPGAVVGHSQGEIAAAHIAGALSSRTPRASSRSAAACCAASSPVTAAWCPSVRLPSASSGTCERLDGRVSMAAVNSPSAVVVSGEQTGLDELIAWCEADGVRARQIPVDYAAHSAQIEQLREPMLDAFGAITPRAADVPLYSTVTGRRIDTTQMDAEYWYRNLRHTVRFQDAVQAIADDGLNALIEISAHPIVAAPILETIDDIAVIASLRRDDGGLERFIHSLAEAHVAGVDVDWNTLFGGAHSASVALPTYAFQHENYWLTTTTDTGDPSTLGQAAADHPLLDAVIALAAGQGTIFTGSLSLERHPWLADHAVLGNVLLPATAFLELALHAGGACGTPHIDELTLSAPLLLPADQPVDIQVAVTDAGDDGRRHLTIHSRAAGDADWTQHATATLTTQPDALEALDVAPSPDDAGFDVDECYDRLSDAGYDYGPAFRALRQIAADDDERSAEIGLDEAQADAANTYRIHPALADGALQAAVVAGLDDQAPGRPQVPFSFTGVRLYGAGASAARARLRRSGSSWTVAMVDGDGAPLLSIQSVGFRAIDATALQAGGQEARDSLFEVRWVPSAAASEPSATIAVAALGDDAVFGEAERYADLAALERAVEAGAPVPDRVVVRAGGSAGDDLVADVHAVTERTLALVQAWLASDAAGRVTAGDRHRRRARRRGHRPSQPRPGRAGRAAAHRRHGAPRPLRADRRRRQRGVAGRDRRCAAHRRARGRDQGRQPVRAAPGASRGPARARQRPMASVDRDPGHAGQPRGPAQPARERGPRPARGPRRGACRRAELQGRRRRPRPRRPR